MHREMGRIDNEPDKDGAIQVMVPNVEKINLRYLDPVRNEWLEEWNSMDTETPIDCQEQSNSCWLSKEKIRPIQAKWSDTITLPTSLSKQPQE